MAMKYIDISEYQSLISTDINADGVILRIGFTGYGSNKPSLDKKFKSFYEAYHNAGVPIGIYYFTIAFNEAMVDMETNWVLEQIKDLQIDLPVWVDVEGQNHSAGWTNLNKATRSNLMRRWCQNVQNAGYYTGIYANLDWLKNKLDANTIAPFDKWVAQYYTRCTYTGSYGMWQYTSSESGKAHGISSGGDRIDASYVYKDYKTIIRNAGLNHLGGKTSTPTATPAPVATPATVIVKKKEPIDVAKEVLTGQWGNGITRRIKLTAAGYNYKEIQALVDQLVKEEYAAKYYIVMRGDTLGKIASKYKTTVANIQALNPSIKNINLIYVGQKIRVR